MNSRLFILSLAVLFGGICMVTSVSGNAKSVPKAPRTQRAPRAPRLPNAPSGNNNGRRNKFSDLNTDVMILIFEHLQLNEIMNVLEACPTAKFIDAGKIVVRKASRDYWVEIDERDGLNGIQIDHFAKRVRVGKKAPLLLKYLGATISKIKISHSSTRFMKLLNEYTSNRLTRLIISFVNENPFEGFEKPFKNLQDLYVSCIKPMNARLTFDKLFPNLNKLTLQTRSDIDSYVVARIPTLMHLIFEGSNKNYLRLLEKNPQIQSLKIEDLTSDYYNVINNNVKNLQNLSISTINADVGDEAVFENVKHLEVDPHGKNFNLLTLPRLESLEIYNAVKESPEWTTFYDKHPNVNRLKIHYTDETMERDLIKMTQKLTNLKECTLIRVKKRIIPDTIPAIIEGNPKLEKLNCFLSYISFENMNEIQRKFEDDWNIVIVESKNTDEVESFFFEKRK